MPAMVPSKPPNMTKKSLTSRGAKVATREPTCGTISIRPSPESRRMASMTGCLLTPNSVRSASVDSRSPAV